jgi:hypothetical protein
VTVASLEEYLAAIKALHACGLNFSAISLIEKADRNFGDIFRGSEINRLVADVRRAAKFPKIGPGIYALTSFEGVGIVLPIQAEEGAARIDDPSASEAWHTAHEFVLANRKEFLSQRPSSLSMPILKPVLPKPFELEGGSFGLPAALAIVSRLGNSPRKPVLATGKLTEKGIIDSVGHIEEKIEAAVKELGGSDGLILIPQDGERRKPEEKIRAVKTLEEACALAFGEKLQQKEPSRPVKEKRESKKTFWALIALLSLIIVALMAGLVVQNKGIHWFENGCAWIDLDRGQTVTMQSIKPKPLTDFRGFEKEKDEVVSTYKGLLWALENCKQGKYFSFFMDKLERYYKKEETTLYYIKSSGRGKWFTENCVPRTEHLNAAIAFLDLRKQTAVITVCPTENWHSGTCEEGASRKPWILKNIFGLRKEKEKWKVFFEYSGKTKQEGLLKYDEYRTYEIDPHAWIEIW